MAKKAKTAKEPTSLEKLEAIGLEAFCAFIESGESLRAFCRAYSLPLNTTQDWLDDKDHPERAVHYARAREARADYYFDLIDDVSDKATKAETQVEVAGLRLKADNIKWKLARMHKKYADSTTLRGDPDAPIKHTVTNLDPAILAKLSSVELDAAIAAAEKLNGQN